MRTERERDQVLGARWVRVLPKVGLQHDLVMSVTRNNGLCLFFGFLELVGQAGRSRTPGFVEGSATSAGLNGEACSHEWMSLGSRLCVGLPGAAPVPFSPLASPL